MALSRRTGVRFQASIWPGFVDAMTGLLLVLMFVLTIFMVMQFVLQETIKGQGTELQELNIDITQKNDQLDDLSGQIIALGEALGLERASAEDLRKQVAVLDASLVESQATGRSRLALISSLTVERDARISDLTAANARITDFEMKVSRLLALQQDAKGQISDFELQIMRLQDKNLEAEAEISYFNTQVAVLLAQNSKAESEVSNFETKVASLLQQRLESDGKISEFEAQLTLLVAQAMEDKERIASVESEVASLEKQNEASKSEISDFELRVRKLLEQQAMQQDTSEEVIEERASLQQSLLAAQATIKAQLEKVALGEKQAELLDEMIADLRRQAQVKNDNLTNALALLATQQDQAIVLAEKEIERLAEAAAVEQLRKNFETSQAALSSLTLQLNEQRKQAEETLTMLAAAKSVEQSNPIEELTDAERRKALLAVAQTELLTIEEISTEAQRQMTLLSLEVAELRAQIGGLQSILGDFRRRDEANKVDITNLGGELNVALAQVASEERKNRLLQEAESDRLSKEAERLALVAKTLEQYKSEFFGRMRLLLEGRDGVSIVGDRFVFSSEVLFASGRADLTPEGQTEIAKITEVLKGIASEMPADIDWILQVDGHTDDLAVTGGIEFRNNWELSQARALSVVLFMVNAKGMDPQRLSANGFGEFQPLNKDNTSAARAQNRRIELKLTGK
ncbi:MAG: peptidoglycan -binding protein [Planktomarina sp.]|nr:peptidoglycan -binding protein [Planktomarina sp.]MDT2039114.1 peptidoglycan -binding protein [Planktomarina sp.]MDT2049035.1 peptidoglycan -binding protein [Planktomarina sp.]|tara:strand:- start:4180 stop:6243 length:2064 start_codon:yes stop_codon:yes gene_type:complete